KTHLVAGDTVTFTWQAESATTVRIDGKLQDLTGSTTVEPVTTITRTLVAEHPECGNVTREITVNVEPVTIEAFDVNPKVITVGDEITATWSYSYNVTPTLHDQELHILSYRQDLGGLPETSRPRRQANDNTWTLTPVTDPVSNPSV